jgi:hypothetical protein
MPAFAGRTLFVPDPLAVLSIKGRQLKERHFQLSLVSLTMANFRMADDMIGGNCVRCTDRAFMGKVS